MQVRRTVYEKSGVELEPEIVILAPDYKLEDHGPAVKRNQMVFTVGAPEGGEAQER